jgi:dipeptidyl-peptidase-4
MIATAEDQTLRDLVETRNFTRGMPTGIKFTPDGRQVLFLRSGPRDDKRALYEFDLGSGATREILSASKLLGSASEELTAAEKARRERMRLTASGLASYELAKDGRQLLLPLSGKLFVYNRATGASRDLAAATHAIDPQWAPDSRHVAYVRDQNVFAIDSTTQRELAITRGGTEAVGYGLAEFVAQEELLRMHGFWWSPDSKFLLIEKADARAVEKWRVNDPMNPDRAGEPQYYPRPGHPNVVVELGVFPLHPGKPVWLRWDREKYPYIASVDWHSRGGLTLQVLTRDQKDLALLRADPVTGQTTPILTEHDDAWVNFVPGRPHWLDDGSGFIWVSEKEPAWQIELRHADGSLKQVLVTADAGARFGERISPQFNAESKQVLFHASPDPTQSQVWRVGIDGSQPVALANAEGINNGWLGPNGALILAHNGATAPPTWVVRRGDGSVAGMLPSVAERPPMAPRVEFVKVGGEPGFYAKIVRPRNFDAAERYPVIDAVYGGPTALVVQQNFNGSLMDQWLADQGFVVVSADGRGTPGRGRSWERAVSGKLADVPLNEQVAALQALGARFPELDMTRVAVSGWSFGGYLSALAVLRRPDIFRAGIAGAPVTDWLDYDTCYTERYLGVPPATAEAYRQNSLIDDAKNLTRPLLLIHGTTDDNVFFRHSLKLADALFRSGREFEFLPLTGFTHMVPDPLVRERLEQRMVDFLRRNLGEPR